MGMTEAAFFVALLWAWAGVALLSFVALVFIAAPYGRHARSGFGPLISSTVGWVVMEAPAPLLFLLFFLLGDRHDNPVALVFLFVWLVHYVNRAFIFPFRRRGGQARMPLSIASSAFLFNVVNAYLQGRYLNTLAAPYETSWLADPRFVLGATLFVAGFLMNLRADAVLRKLRRPGETGYRIPRGGMYRFVSCPNYLGEIIEWIGWALMTWSLPGLVFAAWTAANLGPRAVAHHRFYRARFSDYPRERKALIPYLLCR